MSGYEIVGHQVIYVGSDFTYWKELSTRFKHHNAKVVHTLHIFNPEKIPKLQTTMLDFIDLKPLIIYFDFSAKWQEVLHLARMVDRDPLFQKTIMVGLVEQKDAIGRFHSCGFDLFFVKCAEYNDAVDLPTLLSLGKCHTEELSKTSLAGQEVVLQDFMRVGYISPEILRIESDLELKEGEETKLFTKIVPDVLPLEFTVVKKHDQSIFYKHRYAYDLSFKGDNLDRRVKDWIKKNKTSSMPKNVRILIIDKMLRIFKNSQTKLLKDYPFSVRCQTEITKDLEILKRYRPDMVNIEWMGEFPSEVDKIFKQLSECEKDEEKKKVMELFPEDPLKLEKTWWQNLNNIVSFFKSAGEYRPVIIVFNAKNLSSEVFQEKLGYKEVLAVPHHMELELITGFTRLIEKNRAKSVTPETEAAEANDTDLSKMRFFPQNYSPETIVTWRTTVKITDVTESELTLFSPLDLMEKYYFLKDPMQFLVRLIKEGNTPQGPEKLYKYRALICLADVNDKAYLRRATMDKAEQLLRSMPRLNI
jgi:hypothetical protein